jgi:hypothetical protein
VVADVLPSRFSHRRPKSIVPHQTAHGVNEPFSIGCINDETGLTIQHRFRCSSRATCDARRSACRRFEQHDAEALDLQTSIAVDDGE